MVTVVMRCNIGDVERFVRIVVGLILGNLGFANPGFPWLQGAETLQAAAVVVSLYLVLTGLLGYCIFYRLRGQSSAER